MRVAASALSGDVRRPRPVPGDGHLLTLLGQSRREVVVVASIASASAAAVVGDGKVEAVASAAVVRVLQGMIVVHGRRVGRIGRDQFRTGGLRSRLMNWNRRRNRRWKFEGRLLVVVERVGGAAVVVTVVIVAGVVADAVASLLGAVVTPMETVPVSGGTLME